MRTKVIQIAKNLVEAIDYWKTVRLNPEITKKLYNVDITKLTSKEVKTIRRDIFRYNMLKKYPFLSVSFLTMLWFKHLDFKENPENFLLDYFNKYSNTMFKVNMLNSSIYLTMKNKSINVNLIQDKPFEEDIQEILSNINFLLLNHFDYKTKKFNKIYKNFENPKTVYLVEDILNKHRNIDSIIMTSTRNLMITYLSKSLIEEINSNIKKDIETKINSNEGLSLKQVANIIDILQNHKKILNIDYTKTKNYKLEFGNIFYEDDFVLNNELVEEININNKIKVIVNKNAENKLGVFILISKENKKWLEKQILEFDFTKLSSKEKINILNEIY